MEPQLNMCHTAENMARTARIKWTFSNS